MVMELVRGRNLAEVIDSEYLDNKTAVSIIKATLEALVYIHSKDIVHRDLKLGIFLR
jgi:serine/threonine protein kinase